ncbi:MAG: ATP-dependent DNA helicase RecG [Pseudomonadota bacterium]
MRWKPFWRCKPQLSGSGSSAISTSRHPLQTLSGVGPQLAAKLERYGIRHPQDLLFHLPYRYQDRTRVTSIGALVAGTDAVVCGEVLATDIQFGRRRSLLVRVSDQTGQLTLRFFHFNQSQQHAFKRAAWVQCYGEIRKGPRTFELVHPEYRLHDSEPEFAAENRLTPVYPTTEGIGPNVMRRLVAQSLKNWLPGTVELLNPSVLAEQSMPPLKEALKTIHAPAPEENTEALMSGKHPAQQRLVIEELLAHHLALKQKRILRDAMRSPTFAVESAAWTALQNSLPFQLTDAQSRVIDEVISDLNRSDPTLRLVQGDVGSGKTIIAAAAACFACDSGFQTAVMAPTELLAEQHRNNFESWFAPLEIPVCWLTGKLTKKQRESSVEAISSGKARIVVGTHALFQDEIEFDNLGLIVIDEQHRFGVGQRLALRHKGQESELVPHQLVMSATPIPRSMAMVFYADLDVSNVDELPPGRLPVNTVAIDSERRQAVSTRLLENCKAGRQAYWVCPLIEESDKLQAQAATDTFDMLSEAMPEIRVGLIHGRMKTREKDSVMQKFRSHEIDLLVATTVIEVGVDVPNANLMIIENAERLGLAQLHQLRGRVGRGTEQSSCVLLYKSPLSTIARQRINVLRETSDGFRIAEEDLKLRGPGDMLGTRQTGLQQLRIADLHRDQSLFPMVERIGASLQDCDPDPTDALIDRWIGPQIDYADV